MPTYRLSDFDFELPEELIAQQPPEQRGDSRLLDGRPAATQRHRAFRDLPALLAPGDLLVFNDTRVIRARLHGHKASGGAVEALIERVWTDHTVWAHVRVSKAMRPGQTVVFESPLSVGKGMGTGMDKGMGTGVTKEARFTAEVLGRAGPQNSLYHLRFPADPWGLIEQFGSLPLPPYIRPDAARDDEQRYQTLWARNPGAVAAPTASLHFDAATLQALAERGVQRAELTLHVGAGTFQPVRTDDLQAHPMHREWLDIPAATVQAVHAAHARGARVWAVGTTVLRALESAAHSGVLQAGPQETELFITPGFEFRVVDGLFTNFHLPRSTLLMLVCALAGYESVMSLYRDAIAARYRFFSYGDAMLLERARV